MMPNQIKKTKNYKKNKTIITVQKLLQQGLTNIRKPMNIIELTVWAESRSL